MRGDHVNRQQVDRAIKEHVVEEQGEKINEIAEQVSYVEEAIASPQERKGRDNGQR